MEFSNTNWNLYKSFVVVYETKNLTKASMILKITRSAIGQNVKELSKQLGVILFNPQPKGVKPTGDAHRLYPIIRGAVESIVRVEQSFETFNGESTGAIKMVIRSYLAELYVKDYLKEFCVKYPRIRLEFFRQDGIELLEQNKVDFVIDLENAFKDTCIKSILLFTETGAFIATKEFMEKHGILKDVSKEKLLTLPLIVRHGAWPYFAKLLDTAIEPFVTKTASSESTYSMTKSSIGIGCTSKELIAIANDNSIIELNIKDIILPTAKLVCGYNATLSKPAREFINGFVEFCGDKKLN